MSDKVETAQLAVRPYRSVASQRPARPARERRDIRIIESLNRGVSVAEIAKREDVVEKPTRDPAGVNCSFGRGAGGPPGNGAART